MEANDDLYHECQKELARKDRFIAKLKKENLEVVRDYKETNAVSGHECRFYKRICKWA